MTDSIEEVWEREITSLCLVDFVQQEVEEAVRAFGRAVQEATIGALASGDQRSMEQIEAAAEPVLRRIQALGAKR